MVALDWLNVSNPSTRKPGSSEGFLRSLLKLMDLSLEAPDHTTISRRSKELKVKLEPVTSKRGVHLIIDSTGLSIVGEGEWAAAKHGNRGKRGWRKLHISREQSRTPSSATNRSSATGFTPGV
ncbi:MAG: hypothetical protein ACI841_003971 [Planctomycetota bacterium]|jgi:hypothetical protein